MSSQKNYLQELNEVQREAVTATDGPVLVVAGPGSGKTRVLTYRIAHLIETKAQPWEILTLTFTNKAAREMKVRIEKVVGEAAKKVWAGTFHSTFAKILRVEAEKIGYPNNFTIYDTEDSKSVLSAIIKEMNLDKQLYNSGAMLSRISSAKSKLITPKLYAQNEELIQQDRAGKRPYVYEIYERYTARCKRSGAMDFDDLLYRMFELLQSNPDVAQKYQERFKYVLVDEFQDTNFLQYRIVKKLVEYPNSPRNICVVGDDAQSIYSFRGATIQNILDFENDYKTYGIKIFKLEQNYRSTEHIVQAANELIRYNKNQIQKTIRSEKGVGNRIKLFKALTDTEEGKRVVDMIVEQRNREHLSNKDIAILYRTNAQSRVFEEYLRRYNILYRVVGGLSFYQRKEVKDLLAYMRLAVNPNDDEALKRVINYPKRGTGDSTVDKISELASQSQQSMWQVLPLISPTLGAKANKSLAGFVHLMENFQQKVKEVDAYQAADFITRQSGVLEAVKNDAPQESKDRTENIIQLLDGIKEFVESDLEEDADVADKSLASYLQNIALVTDQDQDKDNNDRVTLMSVHAAKGLEFPSVFVVGLEENLFPSFMSADTMEGIDEERRLFYVAITRAEAYLTLTYAASRYSYGKMRYNEPSRFIEEIDWQHLDADVPLHQRKTDTTSAPSEASNRSTVRGNFTPIKKNDLPIVDPSTFKPSPSEQIAVGQRILHLKFGEGNIKSIDGTNEKRVATIVFPHLDEPEKRIMLKFAKLQILEG